MKPWPTLQQFAFPSPAAAGATHYFVAYERARADAAMERLRVAVETLEYARKHMAAAAKDPVEAAVIHARVFNALAEIGPLP